MEALLMLFNFSAMALILLWSAGVSRKGDAARFRGLLAFGDKPFQQMAKKVSKFRRGGA